MHDGGEGMEEREGGRGSGRTTEEGWGRPWVFFGGGSISLIKFFKWLHFFWQDARGTGSRGWCKELKKRAVLHGGDYPAATNENPDFSKKGCLRRGGKRFNITSSITKNKLIPGSLRWASFRILRRLRKCWGGGGRGDRTRGRADG